MKYRIQHDTIYTSTTPVSVGHNEAWLTPRPTAKQTILAHRIEIHPEPSARSVLTDYFGNTVTQFLFNQGYDSLRIAAVNDFEMADSISEIPEGPNWETVVAGLNAHQTPEELEAFEFTFDSPRCRTSAEFAAYGVAACVPGRPIRDVLLALTAQFHADFQYDTAATTVSTPVEQVFRQKRGVCQDFSHLMISVLRSLGFAARYVSGYLQTTPPPGKPRMVGADVSHAWLSVYAGPLGWIDLDPTNNRLVGTDHFTLAWGRDYSDVAPVKGVYIGGSSPQLAVTVDVTPLPETAENPAG